MVSRTWKWRVVCGKHTVHVPEPLGNSAEVYEVEKGLIRRVKEVEMLQSKKEEKKCSCFRTISRFIFKFFCKEAFPG